ncbi:MAG: hypothetical protein ACK4NH_14750 [Gemmobacter sp.]
MLLKSLVIATTLLVLTLSAAISGPGAKGRTASLHFGVAMASPAGN